MKLNIKENLATELHQIIQERFKTFFEKCSFLENNREDKRCEVPEYALVKYNKLINTQYEGLTEEQKEELRTESEQLVSRIMDSLKAYIIIEG
jgi:hypothetical protein